MADDQNNQFEIATVIEGRTKKDSSVEVVLENPAKEEDPYDYFKDNDVFIHGKNLFISGSASLFGNGTMIINNGDNIPDLILSGGGSKLDSKNISIDRTGKNVIFDDSAHLGNLVSTDVVNIKGNVILNRGTSQIAGKNVYIDGDVEFNNSAFIIAKKLFINGNVNFNNYTAKITADEIYINGTVTKFKPEVNHLNNVFKKFDPKLIPSHQVMKQLKTKDKDWFSKNNYVSARKLTDGIKIYTNDYKYTNWMGTTNNVIIVSEKDIVIDNMGGATLSGVLFAPNGKVEFSGEKFEGVIITKDGINLGQGNTPLTYKNITNYIKNPNDFPLH